MSTVLAIDQHGLHAALSSGIMNVSHASILPGVFDGVGKVDLATLDVEATPLLIDPAHIWRANIIGEDILAEGEPVVRSKELRAHGEDCIGNLEPPEFSADLPHPLTAILVDIIGFVPNIVAAVGSNVTATLNGPLSDYREGILHVSKCDAVEDITHLLPLPILNTSGNCISNVAHEIANWKGLTPEDGVNVFLIFRCELIRYGLFDVIIHLAKEFWARVATSI